MNNYNFESCDESLSSPCINEDIIEKLCNNCDSSCNSSCSSICSDSSCSDSSCKNYCNKTFYCKKFSNNNYQFTSIIQGLADLNIPYCKDRKEVEFLIRRKNATVTLQWEQFSGKIISNGTEFLYVPQDFSNLPPYPIFTSLLIKYCGHYRTTLVEINPFDSCGHIRFYLNDNLSCHNVHANDIVTIYPGSVTWIVKNC